jgi:hypothetical protein
LSAFSALVAVSALSAWATDSPGASLLICFVAIFFTFFLLIALLLASGPATAVPAAPATRASTANRNADNRRDPLMCRLMADSPSGR